MPVTILLGRELEELGLEYLSCSINIIDERLSKVTAFLHGPPAIADIMGLADIVVPFGPETMEQLESEEGPFTITGIPGAEDLWVVCQSMDLENYLARYPKSDETLVISRSEDEARKLVPLWEKAWNVSSWPEEVLIRPRCGVLSKVARSLSTTNIPTTTPRKMPES